MRTALLCVVKYLIFIVLIDIQYEMYYLIKYCEDGILQVVSKTTKYKSHLKAKYYDGKLYEATILARNRSQPLLQEICQNMSQNIPVVILQKLVPKSIHVKGDPVERFNNNFILQDDLLNQVSIQRVTAGNPDKLLQELNNNVQDTLLEQQISVQSIIADDPVGLLHENLNNIILQEIPLTRQFCDQPTTAADPVELLYEALNNDMILQDMIPLDQQMCAQPTTPDQVDIEHKALNNNITILQNIQLHQQGSVKPTAAGIENRSQARQKRHCCFYCQKRLFKIYRHYIAVHKTEQEIRDILALPAKSTHRKMLLDKLRKKGDYIYNTKIKNSDQSPIVCRQTFNKTSRSKDVPCPNCKGFYSKFSIRHHIQRCLPIKEKTNRRANIQVECRKLAMNMHHKASEDLRTKIFPVLNEDEVTNAIRYDEAVISYANYLCRKYTAEHHAQQIRSNIRALGRLILAIKEINPQINNLSEILDPRHVELIIQGIDNVAGLDQTTHLYRAPATAMLLATELKKLCRLLEMECIKNDDHKGQKRMENLYLVFNLEFHVTVNKKGLETQKVNYRRKKIDLPKTEHVAQFRIYLENKIRHCLSELEKQYSLASWTQLAEYTLAHLAVFNRKRPGETQRLLIDDYKNYEIVDEDISAELDSFSKEQIKKWARIRFTGKLGKNTALLVHREIGFRAIDLILKYRIQAGVHPDNRFIFGEPSQCHTQSTLQACNLIRKFSFESNIENPELLRTRLLRQHLATKTAQSNLDSRLEGRVSDFMSHKRQIHEDYYVLTQKTDDITKVSRLLEDLSSVKCNRDISVNESTQNCSKTSIQSSSNLNVQEDFTLTKQLRLSVPHELERNNVGLTEFSSSRDVSSSDEEYSPDQYEFTAAELNYIMGKKQTRRLWTSTEKSTAYEYFYEEIQEGTTVTRKKAHKLLQLHPDIFEHRTPHLIMQWVKYQQKKVEAEQKGQRGQRLRWSTPEKEVIRSSTERHSSEGTVPTISECELLIEEHKQILKKRSPQTVKSHIYSEIKKYRKEEETNTGPST